MDTFGGKKTQVFVDEGTANLPPTLSDAEVYLKLHKSLTALSENWCSKKAEEVLPLLEQRIRTLEQIERNLKPHEENLRFYLKYDQQLTEGQRALTVAQIKHGPHSIEAQACREAINERVEWQSRWQLPRRN